MNKMTPKPRIIFSVFLIICLIFSTSAIGLADTMNYGEELSKIPEQNLSITFTDVPKDHWAYPYIADMSNRKVLSGYPDGKFRPEKTISRAEFAKIIVLAAGLKAEKVDFSYYSDVKITDWFCPYVEAAKNYLTGYLQESGDVIYKPDALALREDIAVAIVKMKNYKNELPDRSIIEAMFDDYDSISEQAKDYVAIAVEKGLMSGFPDSTFRAQQSLDRAQSATLLSRAFKYGDNSKSEVKVVPVITSAPTPTTTLITATPATAPISTPVPMQVPTPAAIVSVPQTPVPAPTQTIFQTPTPRPTPIATPVLTPTPTPIRTIMPTYTPIATPIPRTIPSQTVAPWPSTIPLPTRPPIIRPEFNIPKIVTPEFNLPNIVVPENSFPKIVIPEFNLPKVVVPEPSSSNPQIIYVLPSTVIIDERNNRIVIGEGDTVIVGDKIYKGRR